MPRDEVRRIQDHAVTFGQEHVEERVRGPEDRRALLRRVRRRDEEPAPEMIARDVRGAKTLAEHSRAMRLPDAGLAHQDDEHRRAVWRWRRRHLRAEDRDELIEALRIGTRLGLRGGRRAPLPLHHAPNPRARSAPRAASASSQGRFCSPTMIELSCPLPVRTTVSPWAARPIANATAARRSSITS